MHIKLKLLLERLSAKLRFHVQNVHEGKSSDFLSSFLQV